KFATKSTGTGEYGPTIEKKISWSDSRVGYDQDIFFSIVGPYSPVPVDFVANLDTAANAPKLTWQFPEISQAFGIPVNGYVFRLTRSDGVVKVILADSVRSYIDSQALKSQPYTYSLQSIVSS